MSYSISTTMTAATNAATSQALAIDGRSLNALKTQSGPQAAREAAKQFESLFMREMIKSMRQATMKAGLLDGAEGNLAADMYDQQLSIQMSGQPGGLSEAIYRQIARQMGSAGESAGSEMQLSVPSTLSLDQSAFRRSSAAQSSAARSAFASNAPSPKGLEAFVQHHQGAAQRVAQESGIPAHFMLGQAGHETGWGKGEIRNADGSPSFNLFGIKATKNWTGKVAEVTTTEYIDGKARKVTAKFRAYDSYEASFRDYARLIGESPRYEKAMDQVHSAKAYASELQKAGYATDPDYANKLSRAIASTQRVASSVRNALNTQA